MAFDYKKEYKEFYLPKAQPQLVTVPPMNYIAVRGQGALTYGTVILCERVKYFLKNVFVSTNKRDAQSNTS